MSSFWPAQEARTESLSRRTFLDGSAASRLGYAVAGSLEAFASPKPRGPGATGYGPLRSEATEVGTRYRVRSVVPDRVAAAAFTCLPKT